MRITTLPELPAYVADEVIRKRPANYRCNTGSVGIAGKGTPDLVSLTPAWVVSRAAYRAAASFLQRAQCAQVYGQLKASPQWIRRNQFAAARMAAYEHQARQRGHAKCDCPTDSKPKSCQRIGKHV